MVSSSVFKQAKAKAIKFGSDLIEISLEEFLKDMHSSYFNDVDISFMKKFLSFYETENEYPVEHSALIEYGVMTCEDDSSKVKEKLKNLGLKENVDYRVSIEERFGVSRGKSNRKVYYLSQQSFKLCLARAQRRPGQAVDPVMYAKYFISLEAVYALYNHYQAALEKAKLEVALKKTKTKFLNLKKALKKSKKRFAYIK